MRNSAILAIWVVLLGISTKNYSQDAIFLHQSTGINLYEEGNVAAWINSYNQSNGTSIAVNERLFPYDPWTYNYPYDYWKLWIDGSCNSSNPNIECLNTLASTYDMVIMKHCSPASHIQEDTGIPDITSNVKSLENYKEQYRALRSLFDSYPDTKFLVWTLAPLHRLSTSPTKAERANQFVQWVKNDWLTEDGKSHPNIVIFDFYSLVAELDENPVNGVRYCLKYDYEISHEDGESHPNTLANETAGPVFAESLVNAIDPIQLIKITGITVTGTGGVATITTRSGSLQLSAAVLPADATNKNVTWSIQNGTGQASISAAGLVTAVADGTVTATATATDGSGIKGELVLTIENQNIPSGIENTLAEHIIVSINQSRLKVKMDRDYGYQLIDLYNLSGNLILSRKAVHDMNIFDVSHLPSGLYIVRLSGNGIKKEIKVVKP